MSMIGVFRRATTGQVNRFVGTQLAAILIGVPFGFAARALEVPQTVFYPALVVLAVSYALWALPYMETGDARHPWRALKRPPS